MKKINKEDELGFGTGMGSKREEDAKKNGKIIRIKIMKIKKKKKNKRRKE